MADDNTTKDFLRAMVERDLASGKFGGRVATRFPPEPNGYLHIGHAKAICVDFGIAEEFDGTCNLRFDDTNPTTEDPEFVEAIKEDIRWLGFRWTEERYASDYFEQLYDYAVELIEKELAYVDDHSEDEIRALPGHGARARARKPLSRAVRGREPGPLRAHARRRVRRREQGAAGQDRHGPPQHEDARPDPLSHLEEATTTAAATRGASIRCTTMRTACRTPIEGITHSLCTLEFENNRAIYDWILDNTSVAKPRPEQTEFARLNLSYTIVSKRKLLELVEGGMVDGWDDPTDADPGGPAPARLHASRDPPLLRRHRRGQGQQHGRRGDARARDPRRAELCRSAGALRCSGRSRW